MGECAQVDSSVHSKITIEEGLDGFDSAVVLEEVGKNGPVAPVANSVGEHLPRDLCQVCPKCLDGWVRDTRVVFVSPQNVYGFSRHLLNDARGVRGDNRKGSAVAQEIAEPSKECAEQLRVQVQLRLVEQDKRSR